MPLREAILDLLRSSAPLSAHDLAARIYTAGNESNLRPTNLATVRRVLYELRKQGLVAHNEQRHGRGTRFVWSLSDVKDSTVPDVPANFEQCGKVLALLGSEHAGERAAAFKLADATRSKHGLTWEQLLKAIVSRRRSRS